MFYIIVAPKITYSHWFVMSLIILPLIASFSFLNEKDFIYLIILALDFFGVLSLLGFYTPTCIFWTCVGLLLFLVVLILKRPGKLSKGIMLNKISQYMFK